MVDNLIEDLPYTTSTQHLDNSMYQYSPLDSGCIRLLYQRAEEPGQPIYCDLLVASLRDLPPYQFLSYIWGRITQKTSVIIDHQQYMVYPNLAVALRGIRRQDTDLVLWVDCLCINMDNPKEKSSQVQLMPQIIQSASETIVWLGLATKDSDLAMYFVGHHERIIGKGLTHDEILALNEALISLFAGTWWSRIWVVQEVISSPSAVVACGSPTVPFEKFVDLRNLNL